MDQELITALIAALRSNEEAARQLTAALEQLAALQRGERDVPDNAPRAN